MTKRLIFCKYLAEGQRIRFNNLKNTTLLILVVLLTMALSCAHYSTARRTEAENIINAPIDVVWEKTLEILPTERMTLKEVNKDDYFIQAKKHVTFWSAGDEVSIRLRPRGRSQTIMIIDAGTCFGAFDFGHEGRMVKHIFERIKRASEGALPPPTTP